MASSNTDGIHSYRKIMSLSLAVAVRSTKRRTCLHSQDSSVAACQGEESIRYLHPLWVSNYVETTLSALRDMVHTKRIHNGNSIKVPWPLELVSLLGRCRFRRRRAVIRCCWKGSHVSFGRVHDFLVHLGPVDQGFLPKGCVNNLICVVQGWGPQNGWHIGKGRFAQDQHVRGHHIKPRLVQGFIQEHLDFYS